MLIPLLNRRTGGLSLELERFDAVVDENTANTLAVMLLFLSVFPAAGMSMSLDLLDENRCEIRCERIDNAF